MSYEALFNSFNFIKQNIGNKYSHKLIEELKIEIERASENQSDELRLKLIFLYLHLEMNNKAIRELDQLISSNRNYTAAYLLLGVVHLWNNDEKKCYSSWNEGTLRGGQYSHYYLMMNLLNNPSMQKHVYDIKSNVLKLINFIEDWNNPRIFTDSILNEAFLNIFSRVQEKMILGFKQVKSIIEVQPDNGLAYLAKGIWYFISSHWQVSLENLTKSLQYSREYMIETLTYRAFVYFKLEKYEFAVRDLSYVLARNPCNEYALILRAKANFKRQLYAQCISDIEIYLKYVECQTILPEVNLLYAKALYFTGDLNRAYDIFKNHTASTQEDIVCKFLCLRDLDQSYLAWDCLSGLLAKDINSSCVLLIAQYLELMGEYEKSSEFYKTYIEEYPMDISNMRQYGLLLLKKGDLNGAYNVIKPITESIGINGISMMDDAESSFQSLTLTKCTNQTTLGRNVLDDIFHDICLIVEIITCLKGPITSFSSNAFLPNRYTDSLEPSVLINPINSTILEEFETRMINIADELGEVSILKSHEFKSTPRVVRALGFCILLFSYMFRERGSISWQTLLELFEVIISIANPNVKTEANNMETESNISIKSPSIFLVRGQCKNFFYRKSLNSAHKFLIDTACEEEVGEVNMLGSDLTSLENVYTFLQRDVVASKLWMPVPETSLPGSKLIMQYLGIYGFNLIVRPCSDFDTWSRANNLIDILIKSLDEDVSFKSISTIIAIIWSRHPLTNYSRELGYVMLHAYSIHKYGFILANVLNDDLELYITQMIKPDPDALASHFRTLFVEEEYIEVSKEYIDYWTSTPTVEKFIELLMHSAL